MFTNYFKFHVNVIPGSVVMTFFYKVLLTKNLENGNSSSEFSPIPRGWGELGIQNLARMSLLKCTECCKMSGLQLLLPLSVIKGKEEGRGDYCST